MCELQFGAEILSGDFLHVGMCELSWLIRSQSQMEQETTAWVSEDVRFMVNIFNRQEEQQDRLNIRAGETWSFSEGQTVPEKVPGVCFTCVLTVKQAANVGASTGQQVNRSGPESLQPR